MRTISVAEARRRLSELTSRVAFGGERVVIERHGTALMAWVSLDDLMHLEELNQSPAERRQRGLAALELARASRRQILEARDGVPLPDSAGLIHDLREERVGELNPRLR
jgi:antitoxin (DNA-binding transcriptional repressor) of toxin-antitoxin stability system